MPGFRLNDPALATQASMANAGWSGSPPECVEVDECSEVGAAAANCQAKYGPQSRCMNTIGSYICSPFIVPDSIHSPNATLSNGNLLLTSAAGDQYFTFDLFPGRGTDNPLHDMSFTNALGLAYHCAELSWLPSPRTYPAGPDGLAVLEVTCRVEPGQGKELLMNIHYCVKLDPYDAQADCTFVNTQVFSGANNNYKLQYPLPVFVPGTLFSITQRSAATTNYVALTMQGETMAMTVDHLYLERLDLVTLTFGPSNDVARYDLTTSIRELLAPGSAYRATYPGMIVFTTTPDVLDVDMQFKLTIADQAAVSTDSFSYPRQPIVNDVRGCATYDAATGSTSDCSTEGGDILTVTGEAFLKPLYVNILGRPCELLEHSNERFTCRASFGTGRGLTLGVKSGAATRADARGKVSYSIPRVERLEGCMNKPDSPHITECTRGGGNLITVHGTNFGAAGAQVTVGGISCTGVVHDPDMPHRKLTCTTPPGSGSQRIVSVFQVRLDLVFFKVMFVSHYFLL